MGRRFLHRLEQCIERGGRQHMNLIDDIHLILAYCRQKGGFIPQVADIINAVVGCRIDFGYIKNSSVIDAPTNLTFTARIGA